MKVETIAAAVRRVPAEFVAVGGAVEEEAMTIAVRRVPGEGIAGRAGKVEAIAVAVRLVLGEGVLAGRAAEQEAVVKSRDVAVLDRDFCHPSKINPNVCACARAAYSVPGAVEDYVAGAYDEPIPWARADGRTQFRVCRDYAATSD